MRLSLSRGLLLAVILTTVSISVLVWSLFPPRIMVEELPVKIEGQWMESCLMKLAWAPVVRTGDEIKVTLMFGYRDMQTCHSLLAELYPDENLLIEVSLVFPGEHISPQTTYLIPISSDQSVQFMWNVSMANAGIKQGTLWVFLETVSQTSGDLGRYPILARELKIETRSIFRLNITWLRAFSLLGLAAGIYLSLCNISAMKA